MKTATLIKGKVKFKAGAPLEFEHGARINVVIALENGETAKIWGNPTDPIANLAKGEDVQLLFDGKDYTILQTANQIAPPQAPPQAPTPEPTPPSPLAQALAATAAATITPSMSADVKEWISIYTELEQARPDLQEGTRRAAASTLFMQRCKIREEFSS